MLSQVAPMAEKTDAEFCSYRSLKVDDEVLRLLKLYTVTEGGLMQDIASDILNEVISKRLGRKPINRKPPPPRAGKGED